MKATIYLATSVDGYIARSDGDVSWLGEPTEELMADFRRLMASVDAVVMGRRTYEKVLSFGEWPYTKPVVVLSTREVDTNVGGPADVSSESGRPSVIMRRLAQKGWQRVYVDGGATVRRFLADGVADRLVVTLVPVLLGEGVSLFGEIGREHQLRLVASRVFEGGLVQNDYQVL